MIRLALLLWILAEIAAFALAGRAVGVLGTLGLVLLTALAGGLLLRRQGAATLEGLRTGVRRGGDPLALLLRDGFRLVAALLLLMPGLLGDLVGLLLLLPPVQRRVAAELARRGLRAPVVAGRAANRPGAPARMPRAPVIEAEWEEVAPPPRPDAPPPGDARGGSGWTRP